MGIPLVSIWFGFKAKRMTRRLEFAYERFEKRIEQAQEDEPKEPETEQVAEVPSSDEAKEKDVAC